MINNTTMMSGGIMVVFIRLLVVRCFPFVLFLLAIMLSVRLPFTDFDYSFGIFKLFLKPNILTLTYEKFFYFRYIYEFDINENEIVCQIYGFWFLLVIVLSVWSTASDFSWSLYCLSDLRLLIINERKCYYALFTNTPK
jgi:hypothetical protein